MHYKTRLLSVLALLCAGAAGAQVFGPGMVAPKPPAPAITAPPPAPAPPAPSSEEALRKYASCFTNQNPEIFKTIAEGKAIVRRLEAEGFEVRGLACNPVSQASAANDIPVSEMLAAGFPPDKPLHLVIQGVTNGHRVDQVQRWMDSGMWNWGMKFCLRWYW